MMVRGNVGTVNGKRQKVRVRLRKPARINKGFKGGPGQPVFVIKKRGKK